MKLHINEFSEKLVHTWTPKRTLLLILLFGLVHGIIYVFTIPPWWHYDEAGHFEYSWLIANRPGWPHVNTYDEAMRRQVAESMLKSGFYSVQNYTPDLASSAPVWIGGNSQVGDPPAYYLLTSLPLRLLSHADINVQLYSMRLVSLVLLLLTLFLTWKIIGELFGQNHPLQWIVPVFMALLPGFLDTMTAASNDVGAVAAFTLFLWVSLRLMKQRFSLLRLVWVVLVTGLCYLTQKTVWIAVVILPLVALFAIFRGHTRRFLWAAIGLGSMVGLFLAFNWGDAADWYQISNQPLPTRVRSENAPSGSYIFQVNADTSSMGQFIAPGMSTSLRGERVTLGVWMWANHPIEVSLPVVRFTPGDGDNPYQDSPGQTIQLGTQPVFFCVPMTVPQNATRGWIMVAPVDQVKPGVTIYYDSFSLAKGEFGLTPPHYKNTSYGDGTWDGQPFNNLIRNGSGEQGWLNVQPWVATLTNHVPILKGQVSLILASLQDWQGIGWYYQRTAAQLSNTFWSQVATNKVHLPGRYTQYLLRIISLLGLIGVFIWSWRKHRQLPWDIVFVLGLVVVVIWGFSFLRGAPELLNSSSTIPWARYAMPAIVPTALLLCIGWLEVGHLLQKWAGFSQLTCHSILLAIMVGLDLFTFWGLVMYFYPNLMDISYLFIFVGLLFFVSLCLLLGKQKVEKWARRE